MIIENRRSPLSALEGEAVSAQARALGIELGENRAAEIARDVAKMIDAANAARELIDFNDEPSRFTVILTAPPARSGKRK